MFTGPFLPRRPTLTTRNTFPGRPSYTNRKRSIESGLEQTSEQPRTYKAVASSPRSDVLFLGYLTLWISWSLPPLLYLRSRLSAYCPIQPRFEARNSSCFAIRGPLTRWDCPRSPFRAGSRVRDCRSACKSLARLEVKQRFCASLTPTNKPPIGTIGIRPSSRIDALQTQGGPTLP